MAHKFPDIHVAVDRDRCHGINQLTDGHTAPGIKVIVLDDAFQHRYVKAGLTILLIDYNRPIHLDRMLPADDCGSRKVEKACRHHHRK